MRHPNRWYWLCETVGHEKSAEVSVFVTLSSPGGRKERKQAWTKSMRICSACVKSLAKGKLPAKLTAQLKEAIAKVHVGGAR